MCAQLGAKLRAVRRRVTRSFPQLRTITRSYGQIKAQFLAQLCPDVHAVKQAVTSTWARSNPQMGAQSDAELCSVGRVVTRSYAHLGAQKRPDGPAVWCAITAKLK